MRRGSRSTLLTGDYPALIEMHLDAVAVVLDFMKPLISDRRPALQRGECGGMNPGIRDCSAPSIIGATKRVLVRLIMATARQYQVREPIVRREFRRFVFWQCATHRMKNRGSPLAF